MPQIETPVPKIAIASEYHFQIDRGRDRRNRMPQKIKEPIARPSSRGPGCLDACIRSITTTATVIFNTDTHTLVIVRVFSDRSSTKPTIPQERMLNPRQILKAVSPDLV